MKVKYEKFVWELGLQEKPVLVVGIVKNIEKSLKKDIKNIGNALSFFKEVHWFLVESDSSDNSQQTLLKMKETDKNFDFISIENMDNSYNFRTERLAIARNKYLSHIRDHINSNEFPYVVVADFNLLNKKLSIESVISSWSRSDWDVVTANQSSRYYDIWALRHPLWSPNDCWEQHEFLKKYIKTPEIINSYSLRSRMLRLPKDSDWIPVDSAFGGFAIYKSSFLFNDVYYDGKNDVGNMICEHVPFNRKIKELGARIFINTNLINAHNTDHSRRMTIFYTFLRLLRYFNPSKFHRNILKNP
jgi:hypothetical protein